MDAVKCQLFAPNHKFWFKNSLYSIDATTIDLCLSLFNWAKFRITKGAVKLHVKLNHSGYLLTFAIVTTGKDHEQRVVPRIPLEKGDGAVFDRAFTNFSCFVSLCERNIYFVIRLKKNADYRIVERRSTKHLKNIFSDQIIELKGFYTKKQCPYRLRRIRFWDPETNKWILLLTNQFKWSAATIARVYKDRWQIELFFRALKQQLKVKSFVGTSCNALLTQLWVALIVYLLLCYLKFKFSWSLYILSSILPINLFARRNLWDWLNAPYHAQSNAPPGVLQYELSNQLI
jgi:putative transposase